MLDAPCSTYGKANAESRTVLLKNRAEFSARLDAAERQSAKAKIFQKPSYSLIAKPPNVKFIHAGTSS
jgi:hypothetical protein